MRLTHALAVSTALLSSSPAVAQSTRTERSEGLREAFEAVTQAHQAARDGRRTADRAERLYEQARDAIEDSRYERAVRQLDQLINMKIGRTDAAMYWKAYSLVRLANQDAALDTLAALERQFATSRWIKDARALEMEIRQAAGQAVAVEAQEDEELKLLALRGLMRRDPEKTLPILEQMLGAANTPRVKERALFVISQSRSPRAREVVVRAARSSDYPDLQLKAIRYLGFMHGTEARDTLTNIYRGASDTAVKRAVVQTFFMQRNANALVGLARAERNAELKKEIVSKLAVMRSGEATDYLLELLK
jgi:outer membrane protein assembly factor BamD (BamD/ComL family)